MKKETMITVLVLSVATILTVTPAFGQTSKPIRIGGCLPLTGIYSETGNWVKEGYVFWEEEIK